MGSNDAAAVLATPAFIRAGVFVPTLELAGYHLRHPHDLMHKAIGCSVPWFREVP